MTLSRGRTEKVSTYAMLCIARGWQRTHFLANGQAQDSTRLSESRIIGDGLSAYQHSLHPTFNKHRP